MSIPDFTERSPLSESTGASLVGSLWRITQASLFRWSPSNANGWRRMLLRLFGARVGRGVSIDPTVRVQRPWRLTLEDDVQIESRVILNAAGGLWIGRETLVSQDAHLCTTNHDYRDRAMRFLACPIVIGRGCWLATDAFVGPNTRLGDGSMLAARSTAFGDLPGGMLLVGEPARPRRPRPDQLVEPDSTDTI